MSNPQNNKTLLSRIFTLLAQCFDTRTRLSFGLATAVFTLILLAQTLNFIPNRNDAKMNARKLQTETLALTGSAIAETNRSLRPFEEVLSNTLERADDLISVGLRNSHNQLDVFVGHHRENWQMPKDGRSNDQFMFVPIYRNDRLIGQLEMCYSPLNSIWNWFNSPVTKLALFTSGLSFFVFNLLLRRTLKQLDPRASVPQRVREAFDTLAEGLLILDRNGRIMLANEKFGDVIGASPDQLMGRKANDFKWKAKTAQLPWDRSANERITLTAENVEIKDAQGKKRTFNISSAPIVGPRNKCRGVMVTLDDITTLEQQRVELVEARNAADAANEAKSNFLSRMSHEIRTPMNSIIGYTDILRQGNITSDDQVRYLTTIQSSGEHLLDLINDVLDLSKIEAGQMTVENRPVELLPILRHVIDTLSVKAKEKKLFLTAEIEGKIPQQITSDPTRLKQILINVIGNAIKFTSTGGVKLVSRFKEIGSKPVVEFDIVDTGIGMSKDALATIFSPFTQADDSVTRKFGGTGLGLSISKQLSKSLGGEIFVRSIEGKGTTFTVSIAAGSPVNQQWIDTEALQQPVNTNKPQQQLDSRTDGGHVLVVDDEANNRDLASLMLRRLGMTCDTAKNGLEAFEKVNRGEKFDLVLMDMNMPVMDGVTAAEKMRIAGHLVPLVALTANVMRSEKERCLAAGFNAFLPKPIRRDALLDMLSQYFDAVSVEPQSQTAAQAQPSQLSQPKPKTRPRSQLSSTPPSKPTEPSSATVIKPAPAAKHSTTGSEIPVPTTPVSKTANSAAASGKTSHKDALSVETGIAETLASIGMEIEQSKKVADGPKNNGLHLPEVVRSKLPVDPEFNAIVIKFHEQLPKKLKEIAQVAASDDRARLSDLCHWFVGAAATVGFEEFTSAALELEHNKNLTPQRAEELIQHLNQLYERIELPQSI